MASKMVMPAVLVLAAAACGGSGAKGAGGATSSTSTSTTTAASSSGSGKTAMQACADSAHASCTKRDTCSTSSFLNNLTYGSEMLCEMRVAANCVAALSAKSTGQSPTAVENCVQAYGGYMCTDFLDNNPPTACVPPAGMLATGSACAFNAQCMSTFCSAGPFATCGKCAALPTAGAPCLAAGDCGRDLACVKPAGSTDLTMGTCAAFVPSGGACLTGTAPCQNGFSCVGDNVTTMAMGMCAASVTMMGGACDATRKTMPSCNADMGLVCIPKMAGSMGVGTCQPIMLVATGATCGDIGMMPITGFADCQAGGLCKKAAVTDTTGTCVAPVADGMPCDADPTKGPPCLTPAKCVPTEVGMTAGTCTLLDATKCM
jgi:hypothetical protein